MRCSVPLKRKETEPPDTMMPNETRKRHEAQKNQTAKQRMMVQREQKMKFGKLKNLGRIL